MIPRFVFLRALAVMLIAVASVSAHDANASCPRDDPGCNADLLRLKQKTGNGTIGIGTPITPKPIGFAYTLNNDLNNNGAVVLGRYADGSLGQVAGSPFATGGKGLSCGDFDAQGSVRIYGQYLLAVNPGSDSISVFQLGGGASLSPVPGSPFPSGGSTPLSVTVSHGLVYVANQACGSNNQPNITGFHIDAQGRLTPIPGSAVTFPSGKGPAQVEFSPRGSVLALTLTGGPQIPTIHTYAVQQNGLLTEGPGSPASGVGGTIGFSWTGNSSYLLVSNFGGNAVTVYSVNIITGALARKGPTYPNNQSNMCWTALSPNGRTLYTANFSSNTISTYALGFVNFANPKGPRFPGLGASERVGTPVSVPGPDGTLSLLDPPTPRRGATSGDTKDLRVSPDGKFLYVLGAQARQISIFEIGPDGRPMELSADKSPLVVKQAQPMQRITGLDLN